MEPFFGKERPNNYWWFVKGTEGWTGIVMVVLMAIAFILAQPMFRRNRLKKLPKALKKLTGFNAFWYSHHLFVIVYALLIVHGYYLYLSKKWYKKTVCMHIPILTFFVLSFFLQNLLFSKFGNAKFTCIDLDVSCRSYDNIRVRATTSCSQVWLQKCQDFKGTL